MAGFDELISVRARGSIKLAKVRCHAKWAYLRAGEATAEDKWRNDAADTLVR